MRREKLKRFAKKHIGKQQKRVAKLSKHPFFLPVSIFFILFFITASFFIYLSGQTTGATDTFVIQLNLAGKQQTVPTRARTVGDFLQRIDVTLDKGDVVEPAVDTEIVEDNFKVNVYRARPITIIEGAKKTVALSAASSPREVAESAGVTVFPEDSVEASASSEVLKDGILGEKVIIERATPVNLNIYGTPVAVRTQAKLVKDLLNEKNIVLMGSDSVQPSVDTPITANMQVFVSRSGVFVVTEEEAIAPPIEYVEDKSLSLGTTAVRQKGSPGKRLVTYQIELKEGKEISRNKIQEIIQVEAVKQIVARGRAVDVPADKEGAMAAAGIGSGDYGFVNYIMSRESGWCPTKVQGQYGGCPAFPPATVPSGRGYGIGQATPGSKMAAFGGDWQTSTVTQLKWANSYAKGRFGSWQAAYNYWLSHHNW